MFERQGDFLHAKINFVFERQGDVLHAKINFVFERSDDLREGYVHFSRLHRVIPAYRLCVCLAGEKESRLHRYCLKLGYFLSRKQWHIPDGNRVR